MSSTAAASTAAAGAIPKGALGTRAISAFSGTAGRVMKIALLSFSNALAAWAAYVLADRQDWIPLAVLAAVTVAIDVVYLGPRRSLPAKFMIPAGLFMIAFQVVPIVYTVDVAFTNYSIGHIASKAAAIEQIKVTSLQPPANGEQYTMGVARSGGRLVLILQDQTTHKNFVGDGSGLKPLPPGSVKTNALGVVSAQGYTLLKGADLFSLDKTLSTFAVPTTGDKAIRPLTISSAVEMTPTLRYDRKRDAFVRITDGKLFHDDGKGEFVAGNEALEPGWKTTVGFQNFSSILHDPLVRGPFLKIFAWTIVFATSVVFLSFFTGLLLAIALDKRGLRFQRTYRSLILIPWAMPGFISLMIWAGLLNDDFGVVNRMFHLNVPWLFDANWAKVSCVLVSFWLTVPYFFLVSMGALQSIPAELTEAARVDGGSPPQIFRRVTLPLVLVATSPLLIASFAFNFNNFNNIYLLTGGGPTQSGQPIAGSTDILISYTYKLALATGKGQDYGLASAVSIIIFFIVATISAVSFSRTKALENLN
ncbi:MAG TPA: ABC transporter permease subunit [Gaiellaceae bacterium]|nr:ABC transporter permease subunit [Gaiellaceae bacterium]